MAPVRDSFAALRERPFRLLWTGQALSGIGDSMVWIASAFAVIRLTGSAADLGLVLAAGTIPRVGLGLAAGVWADRLPRNVVMRASDLLRALSQGLVAADLLTGHARIWHLAVAAAVYGAATAFFNPALGGLVPDTVSRGRLQQANALIGLTRSGLGVAGPGLSGALVAAFGPGWVYAIDAASFVGSAACLSLLAIPPAVAQAQRQRFFAELAAGWRIVVAHSWIWATLIAFAVGNFFIACTLVLGPIVSEERLGGAATWGFFGMGMSAGSLAGAALSLRVRPRRPLTFACLITCLNAVPALLFAIPATVPAILAAAVFAGLGLQLSNTLWETVLQQQVPRASRSRVSAYDWMVSWIFMPLGFLLAGPLSTAIGTRAALLVAGGTMIVLYTAIAAVPGVRAIRLENAREPEQEPARAQAPAPAPT